MTTTNHDKSPRLQLSGRNIAGACLVACGLLIIIWGGTLEPVNVTDPDFMSLAVSGLVLIAAGAYLATALPPAARVALIWLATLTSNALSVHPRHGGHRVPDELCDDRRDRRLADHQNPEMR